MSYTAWMDQGDRLNSFHSPVNHKVPFPIPGIRSSSFTWAA